MSTDGQRIKWRRKLAENFNRMSRVHERYRHLQSSLETTLFTAGRQRTGRQQIDGRAIAYSERERLKISHINSFGAE